MIRRKKLRVRGIKVAAALLCNHYGIKLGLTTDPSLVVGKGSKTHQVIEQMNLVKNTED